MNDYRQVDSEGVLGSGCTPVWVFDAGVRTALPARAAHRPPRQPLADPLLKSIKQICAGRIDALDKLYAATQKPVRRLAYRMTQDQALAEEVTQATYLKVWTQAQRYDPGRGSVLTWLLCIARSRSIDACRTRFDAATAYSALRTLVDSENDSQSNPEDQAASAQRAMKLHDALASLVPLQRQLLGLAYFRGATHEEIARQLQLPLGTVKSHIRSALAMLRRALRKSIDHDGANSLGRADGRAARVKASSTDRGGAAPG